MELSRRNFLAGSALAAAAAAASLTGCAPSANTNGTSEASDTASNEKASVDSWVNTAPANIDRTVDVDLVVVGTGFSGSCCMLRAVEHGLKVIAIDKETMTGGATNYNVDTVFALGDAEHERLGQAPVDPAEYVHDELDRGQYRNDGARWWSMIKASPDYIEWLKSYGLEFVTMQSGGMSLPFFKQFPLQFAPGTGGGKVATDTLCAAAREKGVEIMLNTKAVSLIQSADGVVTGLYAESADEGAIQINAKAVVLATGGFGSAPELWEKAGWDTDNIEGAGAPHTTGDGYYMSRAAGGMEGIGDAAPSGFNFIPAFPGRTWNDTYNGNFGWPLMAKRIEVNQDAVRFYDENTTLLVDPLRHPLVTLNNIASYLIFDDAIFSEQFGAQENSAGILEQALADESGTFFKCDTAAEAAEHFGLDAERLKETIDSYNAMCENGVDTEYMKAAPFLQKLKAPFYIGKYKTALSNYHGGVHTSSNMEVLTPTHEAISGLYAIGVDGSTLYRNFYTFGGGAMGHNIYSGHRAADAIAARLKS